MTLNKESIDSSVSTDESCIADSVRLRAQKNIEILRQFKQGDYSAAKFYTGFGGLYRFLRQEHIQTNLTEFLSEDEIQQIIKNTRTGYYTPPILVDFIYQLIKKLGFKQGKILEPACGHGVFFERMPKCMRENSQITGIELEKMSAEIAKALYPDIKILNRGFHHFHETGFDLIIGNPPYASFSVFDKKHPDLKEEMIHHYFVAKCVRLLKEGGLLAMIVPRYILDNPKRHLRHKIAEVANLITAYRMPANMFVDATITVDVVIFQRTKNLKTEWTETKQSLLPNHKHFVMSKYFIDHPNHVVGELDTFTAYSSFEDQPRKALTCAGSIENVQQKLPLFVNATEALE